MKTTVYNAMTMGSEQPPSSVNQVYTMAANWIRMQAVHRQGGATTFVMTSINKTPTKTKGGNGKEGSTQKKEDKSEKMKRMEYFGCHKMGHYASKCPLRKTQVKEPSSLEEDGELSLTKS